MHLAVDAGNKTRFSYPLENVVFFMKTYVVAAILQILPLISVIYCGNSFWLEASTPEDVVIVMSILLNTFTVAGCTERSVM